jgi:hypothetical protein
MTSGPRKQQPVSKIELGHFDVHFGQFCVLTNGHFIGSFGISAIKALCQTWLRYYSADDSEQECTGELHCNVNRALPLPEQILMAIPAA